MVDNQTSILLFALGQLVVCYLCYSKGRRDNTKQIVGAYLHGMQVGVQHCMDYYHQQQQLATNSATNKQEETNNDA